MVFSDKALISDKDLELSSDSGFLLTLAEAKEEFQVKYIKKALMMKNGNRTQAARMLDIDPRTIFRYLEKIKTDNADES